MLLWDTIYRSALNQMSPDGLFYTAAFIITSLPTPTGWFFQYAVEFLRLVQNKLGLFHVTSSGETLLTMAP